jgi:glycerophosphoryl diester phosphodiesterase
VLGPDKAQIFPREAAGNTGAPTTLVANAHAAGLTVVPYTFRAENQFLPPQYRSSADPNAFGNLFAEITDQSDIGFATGHGYSVEHPQAKAAA